MNLGHSVKAFHRLLACVCLALSSCTNLSTLQTATPLASGATEVSGQAWGVIEPSSGRGAIFPAMAWRRAADWTGDVGLRLSYPGNLQVDGKATVIDGRFALSLGLGLGTDVGSLLLASVEDGNDDDSALSLDAFVPFIASYDVVPDYLSVHGTLRPQVWLVPRREGDTVSQFFLTSALGLRAGKKFGVHVEAMPILGTYAGFNWAGAAAAFVQFDGPSE